MQTRSKDDSYAMEDDDDYIKIADGEDAEFMEFPKEGNDTIMLSTLQAQFPHAIGLKHKGSSGAWRAIRAVDNVLDPPKGGWGDQIYYITVAEGTKRKNDYSSNGERESKMMRPDPVNPLLKDMAVIGLPFKTTDEELKEYFERNYGELAYSEVKKERATGKSRGFGFIRFKDAECAKAALNGDHYMMGRKVEVRQKKNKPMKLFIGRLASGTTQEDLNDYFGQYGELTDTYIPTPFRNFAFITMASTEDAKRCMRDTHTINGARVNVMERNPDNKGTPYKSDDRNDRNYNSSSNYNSSRSPNNYSDKGYTSSAYSRSTQQQQPQNDMAAELKSMLYTFLTNQK